MADAGSLGAMKKSAKEAMTVAMMTEIALMTRRVRYVNTVGALPQWWGRSVTGGRAHARPPVTTELGSGQLLTNIWVKTGRPWVGSPTAPPTLLPITMAILS